MLLIDVTIVNVALPDMVGALGASFGALQWVIDAYALALAALVLGAGSIADRVGHRRAYVTGLTLFAISSLMCGFAPNPAVLITARTVQGIGAGAMFATTFALLNSAYAGRDRGRAGSRSPRVPCANQMSLADVLAAVGAAAGVGGVVVALALGI